MRLWFVASALLLILVLAPSLEAQAPTAPRCQPISGSARFFWHYQCVKEEFDRITRDHPDIAKYHEIGKSVENNPIYVLEVANFARRDASNETRPAFYYDATHHGNEIQGTESAMMLARKVTSEYGKDPQVTRWVDELTIYINPVVNPDGNIRNQRHNVNGVDLNRNYPFQHGARAQAAGPSGASEPETKANVGFMRSHPDIDMYLSAHTGTWDYVVPRCSPASFRERIRTDDEQLYEYVLAEQANVTQGMGSRGASGTGESICWAYDVLEVFSLLNEVSTEQSAPFTVQETEQLNRAQQGVHWLLDRTGRYGAWLTMRLAANASKPVVEIHNKGLQTAQNWTFELNYEGSNRPPVLRGNQPVPPNGTVTISIPNSYLQGRVLGHVRYDHLNVNPFASDPLQGRLRDPHHAWLNFTAEQAQQVARGTAGATAVANSPGAALVLALAAFGLVALRRKA